MNSRNYLHIYTQVQNSTVEKKLFYYESGYKKYIRWKKCLSSDYSALNNKTKKEKKKILT